MDNFLSDIEEMSEVLGKENIDCLTNLFKELNGTPPYVNKKRYRADHPTQIKTLNYLEDSAHLIETIDKGQFYRLRTYAIPLIKTQKAEKLLTAMCKLYAKLPSIYKEYLDDYITIVDLLKELGASSDGDTLEALYYFRDTHNVWSGLGNSFPYEGENSQIKISEDVLLKENFLEILTDYYRWNFIKQKGNNSHYPKEISIPQVDIKDKKVGRPSYKEMILSAYEFLKKHNLIKYEKRFNSHIELIIDTIEKMYGTPVSDKAVSKHVGKKFQQEKNLQINL